MKNFLLLSLGNAFCCEECAISSFSDAPASEESLVEHWLSEMLEVNWFPV